MIAALAAALAEMVKELDDDIEEKSGRVLNGRNMNRLKEAHKLLQEVLMSGGVDALQEKSYLIPAENTSVYNLKQALDPVLEYHGISAIAEENGVLIHDITSLSDEATEALAFRLKSLAI